MYGKIRRTIALANSDGICYFCHDVLHTSFIPHPNKGKEPHHLVKLFSYSKTSDAILRYAFRRYFLTVSGDKFISNATCTQERPRTSHSTRHAISSGGSSKDRMYATARRGAIEDNCARIARCCLSMPSRWGLQSAHARGDVAGLPPVSFLPESGKLFHGRKFADKVCSVFVRREVVHRLVLQPRAFLELRAVVRVLRAVRAQHQRQLALAAIHPVAV